MNNGLFGLPPGSLPQTGIGTPQSFGPSFDYRRVRAYAKPGTYSNERVPARVRTILVMVFGGGGDGFMSATANGTPYSGAGGGFAMAEFPVVPGELLPTIVVGDRAGTSSFGQFLSATGGSHATSGAHGTGGSGSFASGLRNARLASGGSPSGSLGSYAQGGGSSGSPYGNGIGPGVNRSGGGGWTIFGTPEESSLGGNGLYACSNTIEATGGGGSNGYPSGSNAQNGGYGFFESENTGVSNSTNNIVFDLRKQTSPTNFLDILRLQEIGGSGGAGVNYSASSRNSQRQYAAGSGGPGAGGGGIFLYNATWSANAIAGNGGIGGGGGGLKIDQTWEYAKAGDGGFGGGGGGAYLAGTSSSLLIYGGDGGIGGGGGGVYCTPTAPTSPSRAGRGGTGAVLIYFTEGQ